MIALETLSIVAGMALASYTLSILLLYKNKDNNEGRLGKTKGPSGKPFALGKQLPSELKTKG